jgi:flagella basal body P-ring formation protein FlgA
MSRTLLSSSPSPTREQGRSRLGCLLASALALCATSAAFAHGTVTLRSSVRVDPGQELVLRDVALLSGPEAVALGDTIVAHASENKRALSIDDVRGVLDTAKADWSRLSLCGGTCTLTRTPDPAKANITSQPTTSATTAPRGATVRSLIPARIAQILGVTGDDLRLTFDNADVDVLDCAAEGRVVEIAPAGAADRMPLQVDVYEAVNGLGFTLVKSGLIRVGVQVRRDVALAKALLSRGDAITAKDVTFEPRWVGPSDRPLAPDELVGSLVKGRIQPGDMVKITDVEAPQLVKKGQIVSVRCIAGSVALKSTARALESGRLGQTIKLQPLDIQGKKDTRAFTARVDGPGRTVTSTPGTDDPQAAPAVTSAGTSTTQEQGLIRINGKPSPKSAQDRAKAARKTPPARR